MKKYLMAVGIVALAGAAWAAGPDSLKEIRRFQERYSERIAKVKSVNGIGITKDSKGRWAVMINLDGSRDAAEVRAELLKKFPVLASTPFVLETIGRITPEGEKSLEKRQHEQADRLLAPRRIVEYHLKGIGPTLSGTVIYYGGAMGNKVTLIENGRITAEQG